MSETYEANVHKQMADMEKDCILVRALPFVLICIDANKGGHAFYPDEMPPEIVAALPFLLDDLRESLAKDPL